MKLSATEVCRGIWYICFSAENTFPFLFLELLFPLLATTTEINNIHIFRHIFVTIRYSIEGYSINSLQLRLLKKFVRALYSDMAITVLRRKPCSMVEVYIRFGGK
jgi:hypothetical protein